MDEGQTKEYQNNIKQEKTDGALPKTNPPPTGPINRYEMLAEPTDPNTVQVNTSRSNHNQPPTTNTQSQ